MFFIKFSVIISTYDIKRINDLEECINSVLKQSYKNFEIIVVVDHNIELFKLLSEKFAKESLITVVLNNSSKGLAGTMNYGILRSEGQIICFIDDDAVADENWLLRLSKVYENSDTYGVGGRIVPLWLCKEPSFLSKEFQWLIGSTDSLYPQQEVEVRNVWSSNISFKKEVFERVGLLSVSLGRRGSRLLQGEDAEFGIRCLNIFGKGITYKPNAIVYHRVYPERVRMKSLLTRAFEQGYSKTLIFKLHKCNNPLTVEKSFLRTIILKTTSSYIKQALSGPDRIKAVKRALFTLIMTSVVLIGFISGLILK